MTTILFKNSFKIGFDGINRLTATYVPSEKVPYKYSNEKTSNKDYNNKTKFYWFCIVVWTFFCLVSLELRGVINNLCTNNVRGKVNGICLDARMVKWTQTMLRYTKTMFLWSKA